MFILRQKMRMQDPALCFLGINSSVREKRNRKATWLFYYFYHYHHCYSRFLSSLVWFYLTLNEQMFTTTIVFLYMRKTSEMEVKCIELANKFIWVFCNIFMEKLNWTFWPTQYTSHEEMVLGSNRYIQWPWIKNFSGNSFCKS